MTEAVRLAIGLLGLTPELYNDVKSLVEQWRADGKTHATEAEVDAALQALSQDIDAFDQSNPPSGT